MFDESGSEPATDAQSVSKPAAAEDPTTMKFKSCRWHAKQDDGGAEYCSHRDVLPYAGMNGFTPEAWCPECAFFKVRRSVKKRPDQLDY